MSFRAVSMLIVARSVEGVMGFTLVLAIEVEITHWEGILVGCL